MITENLSTLKIHKLTQKQYDREFKAGNTDENALYLTPDLDSVVDQTFNPESENAQSGKAVQEAIDAEITQIEEYIEDQIGDIETALDGIIAIQNSLIGGESV